MTAWAEHAFDPRRRGEREHCEMCREGDADCFRDLGGYGGRCPIVDDAPALWPENETALTIYEQAKSSAETVSQSIGSRSVKTLVFVRPTEVEALMRMYGVEEDERPTILARVLTIQAVDNERRPARMRKR